jgi:hypothetical protein
MQFSKEKTGRKSHHWRDNFSGAGKIVSALLTQWLSADVHLVPAFGRLIDSGITASS